MGSVSRVQSGSLADLPIAELFEAEGGEDVGLAALQAFSGALHGDENYVWSIHPIWPDGRRWLATALLFHGEHPDDWVEIDVEVRSSKPSPQYDWHRDWIVLVSFEVSCACHRDHGVHPIEEVRYEAGSVEGFARTLAKAKGVIDNWLEVGPVPADKWRQQAGLPTLS